MEKQTESDNSTCRVCGAGGKRELRGTINGYPLEQCGVCRSALAIGKPDAHEVQGLYDKLFATGEYEAHRAEFKSLKSGKVPTQYFRTYLLKKMERQISGRRLTEIGGGTGSFGALAKRRGWDYTNFDISAVAVDYCRQLSLDAHRFAVGDIPPLQAESSDLITLWEVIEHIWNLHDYLIHIKNALTRGGVFAFTTPNVPMQSLISRRWGPLSLPPIHVNFFTRSGLEKVLTSVGFSDVSVVERRVYLPRDLAGLIHSIGMIMHLREPETLYGFAVKK